MSEQDKAIVQRVREMDDKEFKELLERVKPEVAERLVVARLGGDIVGITKEEKVDKACRCGLYYIGTPGEKCTKCGGMITEEQGFPNGRPEAKTEHRPSWEECWLPCPKCGKSEGCYIDENNDIDLFCANCTNDFTVYEVFTPEIQGNPELMKELIEEAKELPHVDVEEVEVSDDPAVVNRAAEAIITSGEGKQEKLRLYNDKGELIEVTSTPKEKRWWENDSQSKAKEDKKETKDWSGWVPYSHGQSYNAKPICYHSAQKVMEGKGGWSISAGRKFDVEDFAGEYDLVLNLVGISVKKSHSFPAKGFKKWETYGDFEEFLFHWPDFSTVNLPRKFWEDLIAYIKRGKKKVLVFCQGGHGRTGTAVATMLVVAFGWSAARAIAWVRKHYCLEAVENKVQEEYVQEIEKAGRKGKK